MTDPDELIPLSIGELAKKLIDCGCRLPHEKLVTTLAAVRMSGVRDARSIPEPTDGEIQAIANWLKNHFEESRDLYGVSYWTTAADLLCKDTTLLRYIKSRTLQP